MKVEIADNAGFCFGVARAVKMAYALSEKPGKHATYGMLIHNRSVTDDLKRCGVPAIDSPEEVTPGMQVIIRAHGIPKEEQAAIVARGAEVVDATCPFVKKIHNIVQNAYENGRQVIICGDPEHPEVKGINGWCGGSAWVIQGENELNSILEKNPEIPVTIVAQTTLRETFFKKISEILKKHFTNAEKFDTICSATSNRQAAAAKLAGQSDCMIVVGGKNSSNTKKLYDVCREYCDRVWSVEDAKELKKYINMGVIPKNKKIQVGITAGASTPEAVIKEVWFNMTENNEMNFAEALEETLKPLNSGEVVKGVVIGITPTEVQVDIGSKYDGVIPFDELTNDSSANINDLVKMGEEVDVYVVHVSDRDGVVTLSKKKIDAVKGMQELQAAFENKDILTG